MTAPLLAGNLARMGAGQVARKEVAGKVATKTITPENARGELISFVADYSSDNVSIKDDGSIVKPKPETDSGITEGLSDVVEDLSKGIDSPVGFKESEEVMKEAKENAKELSKPSNKTKDIMKKGDVSGIKNTIKSLPTAGGIGLILVLILFILFAIQPVRNGETRLTLIWKTLIGKTFIGDNNPEEKKSFFQKVQDVAGNVVDNAEDLRDEVFESPGNFFEFVDNFSPQIAVGDKILETGADVGDWLGGLFK